MLQNENTSLLLALAAGNDSAAAKLMEQGADISVKTKVVQLCVRRVLQLSPCTRVMPSNHAPYVTYKALSDCSYACMSGGVFRLHRPRRRPCTSLL